MGRECRGNAERLGEIGEESELRRAHRMGTIHRRRIDLRGEFLVVADACRDIGGRGWMGKLVVEEFGRLGPEPGFLHLSKNALALLPTDDTIRGGRRDHGARHQHSRLMAVIGLVEAGTLWCSEPLQPRNAGRQGLTLLMVLKALVGKPAEYCEAAE